MILTPKNEFRLPRDSECMSNVVRVDNKTTSGRMRWRVKPEPLLRTARGDVTGIPRRCLQGAARSSGSAAAAAAAASRW